MSRRHRERRSASSKDVVWAAGVAIGKVSVSSCPLPYATVGQFVTVTANIKSGTTTMGPSPFIASSAASATTTQRYLPTLAARVRSHRSGREPARPYNAKLATPGKTH